MVQGKIVVYPKMGAVARPGHAFRLLAFANKNIYIVKTSIPNHEEESVTFPLFSG